MAFSSNLVKEWHKDKSVEELEKMYNDLKSDFYFESKESQIKYIVDNFMNASHNTNTYSFRKGIEELLYEKTGKEYKIEEKYFQITLNDLIDYISSNTDFSFDKTILINFFNRLKEVTEEEKCEFLICLIQNNNNFDKFLNEIKTNQEIKAVFEKYLEIADNFYSMNHRIG